MDPEKVGDFVLEFRAGPRERAAVELVRKLRNVDPRVAMVAESQLRLLGTTALPALRQAVAADHWSTRWRAVHVLAVLQHPEVVPLLSRAFYHATTHPAQGVIFPASCERDHDGPTNGAVAVRLAVVWGLHAREEQDAIPVLCEALRDENQGVRLEAARAVTQLAEAAPCPQLRMALGPLRAGAGWGTVGNSIEQGAFRTALQKIDAATAGWARLPIPSTPSAPAPANLPRPSSLDGEGEA